MSKQPSVCTEIRFAVEGPKSIVEGFRRWINEEFRKWARQEFKVKADGTARRSDRMLIVTLEVRGCSHEIISRLTADFQNLRFSAGDLWEKSHWSFKTTDSGIEYEFQDENGDYWHGANGVYEKMPYEDEDEEALVEADGAV